MRETPLAGLTTLYGSGDSALVASGLTNDMAPGPANVTQSNHLLSSRLCCLSSANTSYVPGGEHRRIRTRPRQEVRSCVTTDGQRCRPAISHPT